MSQQPDKFRVSLTQPPGRARQWLGNALPPDTLLASRYRLRAVIGRGGMSTVYRAEDMRLGGRVVAIKEVVDSFNDLIERQQALEQFEREASLLATLDHPNLPHVSDYFSEGGRHYIVMELVEGQTLATIQRDAGGGALPPDTVLGWAAQLCLVLEYLHSRYPAVIFRDLKPDNVMLDQRGRIKLIDFGIVRLFDPGKRTDTLKMGTVGYAPPEQYSGRGTTDPRSDIYALGVMLHQLSTGHDPSSTPFALPPARKLNSALSPGLSEVLAKAIQLEPRKRWQTVGEFREALFATTRGERVTRHLPMNRTVVAVQRIGFAGLILGLVALFVGVFVFLSGLTIVQEVASGTLRVYTQPEGVQILVDGQNAGNSPVEVQKLLDGNHSVEVRSEKYEPWAQQVDIVRGEIITVTATLVPKVGNLQIEAASTANGVTATVEFDGKVVGSAPLRLEKLEPGQHRIRISAPQHKPLEQTVEVKWKETARISPILEPLPGTIIVEVSPVDAEVWIDNRAAPKSVNGIVTISGVVPGTHEVRFQRNDYFRKSITVALGPEEQVRRNVGLERLPGGTNQLFYGRAGEQSRAGFVFKGGVVVPGNALNDFQFEVENTLPLLAGEVYKINTRDSRIVEMIQTLEQVEEVPETVSFNNAYVGPLQGRVFIIKTREGKYAKIEILKVEPDLPEFRVTFRWVYQPEGRSFK